MRYLSSVVLALALGLLLVAPGLAQEAAPPVVRAVLFYSPTCPHCHYVMDEVLPPLRARYGGQLEILEINASEEAGARLYYAAIEALAIPQDRLGVPALIVGDVVLVGSLEIPEQLPGLIEQHLAAGGVGWPAISGLEAVAPPPRPAPASEAPVVQAVLFWSSECLACRTVVADTLPPLREQYGDQLDVQLIDVVTAEDVDRLYQVAAAFGIAKDDVDLPLLIIGDRVLVGADQIPAELPGLIEAHLAAGGVALPNVTGPLPTPGSSSPAVEQPVSDGFALAVTIMAGMVGALIYAGVSGVRSPQRARSRAVPRWRDYATPALAVAGLGVALYLAYVETQSVAAVCGPVGDCNAVQSSPYARLFGVLPIGVLGAIGYAAILAAWLWGRVRSDRLAACAPPAVFAMSAVGVLFSLYLTFLEPFVIRAVCAWCLASAVIMTLLMLFSLGPARQAVASNHARRARA